MKNAVVVLLIILLSSVFLGAVDFSSAVLQTGSLETSYDAPTAAYTKTGNPAYSMIEYQCRAPQTIDGKWTTADEWVDGPPITMSNNARFTYNIDFNNNYEVCWLVEFFTDNTNDAGDYWQICFDSDNSGGTAPQVGDCMVEIIGHTTLKVYNGTGTGWTEITPGAGEFSWNNSISATPWGSISHWILEFSDNCKIDGSLQANAPPNGMRVAAYDANTGTLAAWAPNSNVNVPDEWGVISEYSMYPYPRTSFSAWASVVPTIDGVISPGEWDDADSTVFYMGPSDACRSTLYVKNDFDNLYMVFKIEGVTYGPSGPACDVFRMFFDNDNDGVLNEEGDDILMMSTYGSIPSFDDQFRTGTGGIGWDTSFGGSTDGQGKGTHTNPTPNATGAYTFEMSHPLNSSDDAHDFSLKLGDKVGFYTEFAEGIFVTNSSTKFVWSDVWPTDRHAEILTLRAPSTLNFALSPNPALVGQSVTLLGNLKGNGQSLNNTKVSIYVGGSFAGYLYTNASGWFKASAPVTSPGTFIINVTYAGNATYNASSHTETLTVFEPKPSFTIWTDKVSCIVGDTMKVYVRVQNPGVALPVRAMIKVTLPDGSQYGPLLDMTVTLPAGFDSGDVLWNQLTIPNAPLGNYKWVAELRNPVTSALISQSTWYWQITSLTQMLDWPVVQHDMWHTGYASAEQAFYPPLTFQRQFNVTGHYVDGISFSDGKLFTATGSGSYGNTVYAFDSNTGAQLWNFTLETGVGAMESGPTVANGIVYFGGQSDDKLYALNATTGVSIWNFTGMGSMYCSNPIVYDGIVYAKGANSLVAVNAQTGDKVWDFPIGGWAGRNTPAIWNGTIYIGSSEGFLYAIDAKTGQERWRSVGSARPFTIPLISDGLVFTDPSDNTIRALNLTTGEIKWNIQLSPERYDQISRLGTGIFACAYGTLYVSIWNGTNSHGGILALNASTGANLWYFEMENLGAFTPIVTNGVVYVTCSSNSKIYALDAYSGGMLWSIVAGSYSGVLILAHGTLYVGGWNSVLAYKPL
jgi:outer membrane protein assembly factor BamB